MWMNGICKVSGHDQQLDRVVVVYPEVGPRLGHLQLPVVLSVREALEAQHLPRVVEASLVWRDGPRPRGQMLRPAVLLGEEQVSIGRAGVEGQRTSVWNDTGRDGKRAATLPKHTAGIRGQQNGRTHRH